MLWCEYGLLSCFILLPLLLPGYILTLDLVFTPHNAFPAEVTNSYLLQLLLWAFGMVLPGDAIEKILLFVILLFSGVGMHLLIVKINNSKDNSALWKASAYFAGVLYMINPFVYSRFMAGQWMFLLGYALLPFFVRALYDFFKGASLRSAVIASLWACAIVTVSIHHIGILILLGLFFAVAGYKKYRKTSTLKEFMKRGISATLLFFALIGFWLVPALFGSGSVGESVLGMDQNHFTAFATDGAGMLGPVGEVVRLQGFWAEVQDLFVKPQALVPGWGIIVSLLWVVVIVGGVSAWRRNQTIASLGMFCIGIGIVLSATPLIQWAGGLLPLLQGYREPHKFANFIALGYAILGSFGVRAVARWAGVKWGNTGAKTTLTACLMLPIIITPVMFWGFSGQLAPRAYPAEWHALSAELKQGDVTKKVLFLPWHQYSAYSFTGGRIIANPAAKFFENPTIISDNPEFKNISPTKPDPVRKELSDILGRQDATGLGDFIVQQKISFVVLAKEQQWQSYGYLKSVIGLRLIKENDKLLVYKMEDF